MDTAALLTYGIFLGVIYTIDVIGHWKIFTKMGIPGWKSLIPFYNIYLRYQNTWQTKYFWVMLVLFIVRAIIEILTFNISKYIGWGVGFVATYIEITSMFRLSKCFGKGIGYAVGLCFLTPFFMMGLGFGKSEYLGNLGANDELFA